MKEMDHIHTVSQCTVSLTSFRSWAVTAIFVVGCVFFTQLFSLLTIPEIVWIPFFLITIFVAYRYGWKMGLVTAIASPAINYVLFGTPGVMALSIIMFAGAVIASVTAYISFRIQRGRTVE